MFVTSFQAVRWPVLANNGGIRDSLCTDIHVVGIIYVHNAQRGSVGESNVSVQHSDLVSVVNSQLIKPNIPTG